ncbi:MAG TPA: hypothetical protein VK175_03290 [Leadbetterella sp.]|nr:hypothetical protein [Leadbetterella sp.]
MLKQTTILLGIGMAALAFTSCEKDGILESATIENRDAAITTEGESLLKLSELPLAVKAHLSTNFPKHVFVEAKKYVNLAGKVAIDAKIKVGTSLYICKYDLVGNLLELIKDSKVLVAVKETDLLPAIKSHLKVAYPLCKIVSIHKDADPANGFYELRIDVLGLMVTVNYDKDGKFLLADSIESLLVSLKENELLPAITSHLKLKYSGYVVLSSVKCVKNNLVEHLVNIKVGSKFYDLKFNALGLITNTVEHTVLSANSLLANIKAHLNLYHKGYVLVEAKKYVINNVVSHVVAIKHAGIDYLVTFDGLGIFTKLAGSNGYVELMLKVTELPLACTAYMVKNHLGYALISAKKIVAGGVSKIVCVILSKGVKYELSFDLSGKLLLSKKI